MEFGLFTPMGSRDLEKPTAEVFPAAAEQTRLADEFGDAIAWFESADHLPRYPRTARPKAVP